MSEIEKMYKNAGVRYLMYVVDTFPPVEYPQIDFTKEKQLEIVKQILFSTWWMNLKRLQFAEKFDEGLAQMINELWQDLTEEERKQIKNILQEVE